MLFALLLLALVSSFMLSTLIGRGRLLIAGALGAVLVVVMPGVVVFAAAPASAPAAAMDPQVFNLVVAAAIGAGSSYFLQWAPANWKGKPMVMAAFSVSIALELGELFFTGGLQHWSWTTAADVLTALAGQQAFFALLKDDLKLSDGPATPDVPPSASQLPPPAPPATK